MSRTPPGLSQSVCLCPLREWLTSPSWRERSPAPSLTTRSPFYTFCFLKQNDSIWLNKTVQLCMMVDLHFFFPHPRWLWVLSTKWAKQAMAWSKSVHTDRPILQPPDTRFWTAASVAALWNSSLSLVRCHFLGWRDRRGALRIIFAHLLVCLFCFYSSEAPVEGSHGAGHDMSDSWWSQVLSLEQTGTTGKTGCNCCVVNCEMCKYSVCCFR